MPAIDKKTLEHLAKLARLELDPASEDKMLSDLENILAHFEELKALDTDSVAPLSGGTELKNVLRDDASSGQPISGEAAKEVFPERENGFLKIPPVFE